MRFFRVFVVHRIIWILNLHFLIGILTGLIISNLIVNIRSSFSHLVLTKNSKYSEISDAWNLERRNNVHRSVLEGFNSETSGADLKGVNLNDEHFHHDDDHIAKELSKQVRVLCWIMTSPQNLYKKAIHVRNTWGKRCNILLFFSSVDDKLFPAIGLNVSEGREHLTAKTMKAFEYVYKNYYDKADWFMKADDDTYVILENLRYFLSSHSPKEPVFFGHKFKLFVKQGYYSGGAGYVLSKEALRRFATKSNEQSCRKDGGPEDTAIAKCLELVGVRTENSTDKLGRSRFHCFNPENHLHGSYPSWYYQYDANGAKKGLESISDYAISFHYVNPNKMYTLEFYIYHLRPYGISSGHQDLNLPHPEIPPNINNESSYVK